MDATGTPFRKVSDDTAFSISVKPVAAITNTKLPYKITGQIGRDLVADVCGDNDLIAGFPASALTAAQIAAGEAVRLDRAGYFDTVMIGGAGAVGQPITAAVGGVRVAVVTTDLFQGFIVTAAAQNARVTVRLIA